jgi:hypothetical protein
MFKGDEDLKEIATEAELPQEIRDRTELKGSVNGAKLVPATLGEVVEIAGTPTDSACINIKEIRVNQVQPGGVLKDDVTVQVTPLTTVFLDDVIQQQVGANVGFLGFTTTMGKNDRAEVLIQDVAGESIDNFNAQTDPIRLKAVQDAPLSSGICGRYILTAATATSVSYRVYQDKSITASILSVLNIGGKAYRSRSKQRTDYHIGVALQPVRLASGSPTPPPPKTLDVKLLMQQ